MSSDATSMQDWLTAEIQHLLRLSEPPASGTAIRDLGLTSLLAVTLQYRLSSERGAQVPLDRLMGAPSLSALALELEGETA